jgi:YHS domain-containing protein
MFRDPVCGKDVEPTAAIEQAYSGVAYFFCSDECREQFEREPELYAVNEGSPTQSGREA